MYKCIMLCLFISVFIVIVVKTLPGENNMQQIDQKVYVNIFHEGEDRTTNLNNTKVKCVFYNKSNRVISFEMRMYGNTLLHSHFKFHDGKNDYELWNKCMISPEYLEVPQADDFIYLYPGSSYSLVLNINDYILTTRDDSNQKLSEIKEWPAFIKGNLTFYFNYKQIDNAIQFKLRKDRIYWTGSLESNELILSAK